MPRAVHLSTLPTQSPIYTLRVLLPCSTSCLPVQTFQMRVQSLPLPADSRNAGKNGSSSGRNIPRIWYYAAFFLERGIMEEISINRKGEHMKSLSRMVLVSIFAVSMLTSCIVSPRGEVGLLFPPPLPFIVELGPEPYYSHQGYQYYYNDNRWQYSRDRGGPWTELPRSHWPQEIRRGGGDRGYERR
jgi:hypothetical protein